MLQRLIFRLSIAWHCLTARRVIVLLPYLKGSEAICDARIYKAPGPLVWGVIEEWAIRRHQQAEREATDRLLADVLAAPIEDE